MKENSSSCEDAKAAAAAATTISLSSKTADLGVFIQFLLSQEICIIFHFMSWWWKTSCGIQQMHISLREHILSSLQLFSTDAKTKQTTDVGEDVVEFDEALSRLGECGG